MGDEMVSSKLRFIVLAVALHLHSVALAEIDWADVPGLSESDKTDITQLAQNLGMHNASSASDIRRLPGPDRYIVVRSEVFVSGLRRTWREFYACTSKEASCSSGNPERVGDWSIDGELSTQERWRFSDGDWFVDVELGTGISYAEAESIVLAFHRDMLVNTPESSGPRRRFDASEISFIRTIDPIAREFEVNIDQGNTQYGLRVRLRGDEVQLEDGGRISVA